jgi:hypothetical protein
MRKILLSVVACCAVIAILPASALAHGDHHKGHHNRAHHARVHHRQFGGDQGAVNNQDQNAGTVQSFTGGVLTIALTNGQTVSGQVTGDTEIECQAVENDMSSLRSQDRHGGDGNGNNDNGNNDNGDDNGNNDQGQGDDDNDDAMCDSSNLTPGTVVHEAKLGISSAGATWDKVELVTAAAADNDNDND